MNTSTGIVLTGEQKTALDAIIEWYKGDRQRGIGCDTHVSLAGFAGTGKSTLITEIVNALKAVDPSMSISIIAFTGKASQVVKSKLEGNVPMDVIGNCSTIHRLIYHVDDENVKTGELSVRLKTEIDSDIIIVDEASMVNREIFNDLTSFGCPIIAVGDGFQLPPIGGNFNLMDEPDLRLTQIHRQAQESPIIQIASLIRENQKVPVREWSENVRKFDVMDVNKLDLIRHFMATYKQEDSIILVGTNKDRVAYNKTARAFLKRLGAPQVGDRVICLRNNYEYGVFNGMTGTIEAIGDTEEHLTQMHIRFDGYDDVLEMPINTVYFNNLKGQAPDDMPDWQARQGVRLDYGYAITVHKSQGSAFENVLIFEDSYWAPSKSNREDDVLAKNRWFYTGVTRAVERLYIVGR